MISYAAIPLTGQDTASAALLAHHAPWLDPSTEGAAAPESWGLHGPDGARRRVGVLRWPPTASAWATGCFLATDGQAEAVRRAVATAGNAALPLVVGDGVRSITALLSLEGPPRPLCQAEDGKGLWLLDLVDERYYWRGLSAHDVTATATGSWADFWAACADALGEALAADVAEEYGPAPPAGLHAWWAGDLPGLLDAAAAHAGMVVVRELAGGLAVLRPETALARHQANIALRTRKAGGLLAIA